MICKKTYCVSDSSEVHMLKSNSKSSLFFASLSTPSTCKGVGSLTNHVGFTWPFKHQPQFSGFSRTNHITVAWSYIEFTQTTRKKKNFLFEWDPARRNDIGVNAFNLFYIMNALCLYLFHMFFRRAQNGVSLIL